MKKIITLVITILLATNCGTNLPKAVQEANELENKGAYKKAAKVLLDAEKNNPTDARYPYHLAMLYQRKFNELFKGKIKSIQITNADFEPIGIAVKMTSEKGKCVGYMLQDLTPITKPLLRSIKKDPNFIESYLSLGRVWAYMDAFKKSINILQKGLNNFQDYRFAHFMAFIYDSKKMYKQAIKHYEIAGKLNPDFSATFLNKGLILFKLNRESEALKAMSQVITLNNNKRNLETALNYVFNKFYKLNEFKKATNWGKKHIAQFEKRAKLFLKLGKAAYLSGEYKFAQKVLIKAAPMNRPDPLTYALIGQLALSDKDFSEAKAYFTKSLNLKETVQVLYQLGSLYLEKFNNPKKAAELLKKAITKSPQHTPAIYQLTIANDKLTVPKNEQIALLKRYITLANKRSLEKKFITQAQQRLKKLESK